MAQKPTNIDNLLEHKFKEHLKVLLVIKGVGFSWQKELQNSFNISNSIALETIKLLEKEGFIFSRDYWKIPADTAEIIRITNAGYFEKHKNYPKIFMPVEDERTNGWFEVNEKEIKKNINNSGTIFQTMELINAKRKVNDKLMNEFNKIENTQTERMRIADNGIYYLTLTEKGRQEKLERLQNSQNTKKAILELQAEGYFGKQKQISQTKKNNLITTTTQNNPISLIGNPQENSDLTINGIKLHDTDYKKILNEQKKIKREDTKIEKTFENDLETKDEINKKIKINEKSNKYFWELENLPQIKGYGKTIEQLEKEHKSNENFILDLLQIKENNIHSLNEDNRDYFIIAKLVNTLKKNGRLSLIKAQSSCGSEKIFNSFQENLKELNVGFNGEDFILKK